MNLPKIPKQSLPILKNERIVFDHSLEKIRRYFAVKYSGEVYEITQQTYNSVRTNPFFDFLIINWYIRGNEEFVRTQNINEIKRGSMKISNLSSILVNTSQFYQK